MKYTILEKDTIHAGYTPYTNNEQNIYMCGPLRHIHFNYYTSSDVIAYFRGNSSGTVPVKILCDSFTLSNINSMSIDGQSVTPAKTYSFNDNDIHEIRYSFSKGITSIPDNMFAECSNLVNVVLPTQNITQIGFGAFAYTNITSIKIPDTYTSVGDSAFSSCYNLSYVELGAKITTIGTAAFYNCRSLQIIWIPEKVGSLDVACFQKCTALKYIYLERFGSTSTICTLGQTGLNGCSNLTKIYVHKLKVNDYKTATNWSSFSNIITGVEESVFHHPIYYLPLNTPTLLY